MTDESKPMKAPIKSITIEVPRGGLDDMGTITVTDGLIYRDIFVPKPDLEPNPTAEEREPLVHMTAHMALKVLLRELNDIEQSARYRMTRRETLFMRDVLEFLLDVTPPDTPQADTKAERHPFDF
jgi:hypothetical protein